MGNTRILKMFDELKKYKNTNHFFFEANQKLIEVCNAPTDKSGVYLIYKLAKGKIDLVYIGSSGQKLKDGTLKTRKAGLGGIKDRLVNGKQFGDRRKITFPIVMKLQQIDALDIYWYVTYDEHTNDFPSDIEEKLIAKFHSIYGKLPEWNMEF